MTLNIAKLLGEAVGIDAMLAELERFVKFSVIFLPESDAHLDSKFTLEFKEHLLIRRWPGEGSFAYSILVHKSWMPYLVDIKHKGRSACF